jgi:hypothetical protein
VEDDLDRWTREPQFRADEQEGVWPVSGGSIGPGRRFGTGRHKEAISGSLGCFAAAHYTSSYVKRKWA